MLLLALTLGLGRSFSTEHNSLVGDPVVGGRLYDNWMAELDLPPPDGDQPLWADQTSNTRSGRITWRCKECHGWDYKGAQGAYGPAALRYTGFPGVNGVVGNSLEQITAWLDGTNNPNHNFLAITNPAAVEDLAAFLLTMQIDTSLVADPQTGAAYGDEQSGAILYANHCADCHGSTGRSINFEAAGSPVYLGDVALIDPWRTVHKIRFGIPGSGKIAAEEEGWSLREVADVLAFMQSFPRGNPNYTIQRPEAELASAEAQGEMEPIIWAASAMIAIVALGLGWDAFEKRPRRS